MSKRKGNNRDGELAAYFKFAVRNGSRAIIARFHQYDHALEFACLTLARMASANTAAPSHALWIEWTADDGRKNQKALSLTVQLAEVSG